MKKNPEGLIVSRFKSGETVMTIALDLKRSAIFVEEAIRAYLLAQEKKK